MESLVHNPLSPLQTESPREGAFLLVGRGAELVRAKRAGRQKRKVWRAFCLDEFPLRGYSIPLSPLQTESPREGAFLLVGRGAELVRAITNNRCQG